MKTRIRITAVLLGSLLLLCGCGKEKAPLEPTPEEARTLIDAYLEYEKYTVYDASSMEADWDHPVDVKGRAHRYAKVTDPRYDSWEEWTDFAGSIFCGKYLIQVFNDQTSFVAMDGDTYCFGAETEWTLTKDYTYEITHPEDADGPVLELRREDRAAGYDPYSDFFLLEKTADGWRIAGLYTPEEDSSFGAKNPG